MPREPSGGTPVFAYGSLLWQPVIVALLGRVPKSSPAILLGYKRFRVKGERFPGIMEVPTNGTTRGIRGLLLEDLSPWEAAILDEFEDDEYDKRPVSLLHVDSVDDPAGWAQGGFDDDDLGLVTGGNLQQATGLAFVWTVSSTLEEVLWQPPRDFVPYLDDYLVMCDVFVREELPSDLRQLCLDASAGAREVRISRRQSSTASVEIVEGILAADAAGRVPQSPGAVVRLSGLSDAVAVTAATAAKLVARGSARIQKITTAMVPGPRGAPAVPQLVVHLVGQPKAGVHENPQG